MDVRWLLFAFVSLPVIVRADYQVEVRFFRYWNPSHRDGDGDCCEGGGGCTGMNDFCENFFQICVIPDGGRCGDQSAPFLVERRDEELRDIIIRNNDDLMFEEGEEAVQGLPNPVVFNISGPWPGDTQSLLVEVFDADGLGMGTGDIVDNNLQFIGGFIVDLANVSPGNSTGPVRYSNNRGIRVNSVMNTFINMSISLRCAEDYYGPECNRLCVAEDSDEGHYTCDSEGFIVCRDGYRNTSSNCTQCVPAQGCSDVGGFCEEPGECICRPGYNGTFCELDLDPCGHMMPCENGATCINTGVGDFTCTCPEGFEGEQCQQIRTDECDPNPCQNGGTCEDLLADYMCSCPVGYAGRNCSDVEGGSSGSESGSGAALAGGVVGIVVLILLVVVLAVVLGVVVWRKRPGKVIVAGKSRPSDYEEFTRSTEAVKPARDAGINHPEEYAVPIQPDSMPSGPNMTRGTDTGSSVEHEFDNPIYGGQQEDYAIPVKPISMPMGTHSDPDTTQSAQGTGTGSSVAHEFGNPIYGDDQEEYATPIKPPAVPSGEEPLFEYDYTTVPSGLEGPRSIYDSADDPSTTNPQSAYSYAEPSAMRTGVKPSPSPVGRTQS